MNFLSQSGLAMRLCFTLSLILIVVLTVLVVPAECQEYEFCNNFLMNLSFVTGTDRGMIRNLHDNFGWMQTQGYTHLRFFGIFPNRIHCFASPTLDENGYPNSPYHEPVLELMIPIAADYGITVNFDGWETIAEANYDTASAGVGYISPEEVAQVVQEVLDLGVVLISEEQFGSGYLQAIQSTTSEAGATHETTAALWYQYDYAAQIADAQLANIFCFFPRDQVEADSIIASGKGYDIAATMGTAHVFLESPTYFETPVSLAVGSFGTLQPENWRNVLRFTQLQHHPSRFSIEEQDHSFLISGGFDFGDYIRDELSAMADAPLGERPTANLVLDISPLFSGTFLPTFQSMLVSSPAIANTFTQLGYKVVATVDSVIPNADAYYLLLSGGVDELNVAPLPEWVTPLLESEKPVFIQPTYGIPDDNDDVSWQPLRHHFGLPPGNTQSLYNAVPEAIDFGGFLVLWSGIEPYVTPGLELLPVADIDTLVADPVVTADVSGQESALVIASDNCWLVNSGVIHLEASYVLSCLLDGPSDLPSGCDVVITDTIGLVFAEYDTDVELALPWVGHTRERRFDPSGDLVVDREVDFDGSFTATMLRGELVVLNGSDLFVCGDANHDTFVDIDDAVYLIEFIFTGGSEPIPIESAEVDCSGAIDIDDVVHLITYIFGGGLVPCDIDGDGQPDC